MAEVPDPIHSLVPEVRTLKDIGIHKGLAKFGDVVTNFIYSRAKSILTNQLDAMKVNRTILSGALKAAGMKPFAKARSDAHAMADTVEAFVGYMYCTQTYSILDMTDILVDTLRDFDLDNHKQEIEGATLAFSHLLTQIRAKLEEMLELDPQ